MPRGLASTLIAELGKDHVVSVNLLDIVLDSGELNITNGYAPIVWGGKTYQPTGHFLTFEDVDESAQAQVNDCVAQLSGVDKTNIALVLSNFYLNRTARLFWAVLDEDSQVIDALKLIEGRMDAPTITEDPTQGTSTVSVRIVNIWSDYARQNGRRTNSASQAQHFPDDRGFSNVSNSILHLVWGSN